MCEDKDDLKKLVITNISLLVISAIVFIISLFMLFISNADGLSITLMFGSLFLMALYWSKLEYLQNIKK